MGYNILKDHKNNFATSKIHQNFQNLLFIQVIQEQPPKMRTTHADSVECKHLAVNDSPTIILIRGKLFPDWGQLFKINDAVS